ncbi:MAG: S41 family peptidase [Gemmatimonadales bacterium]
MRLAVPCALILACIPVAAQSPAPHGYYRFPAIHGDTVVFTAEGDLWVVGAAGGRAERLTSNPGIETNAAISPDGRTVAFTGTYEGPADVYTMPIGGGLPARRTFTGGATVVGWTADGAVLYATRNYSTLPNTELVRLDTATGTPAPVPLAQASDGAYDLAGTTLFFTRQAFQGSHTRRYHGGTAQNLWRYGAGDAEARPLTADYAGTSKNPMVWQGRVYFLSDRDGTMNIWSMNPDGGALKQETHHDGWDVRGASLDGGRIVYQLGADLWLYTIATGDDRMVPITLASDLDQTREHWVTKPMDYLSAAHLSPTGDRVVLTARGQVFVAPAGSAGGRLVEASRRPGVRYRSARFAPDGRSLYVLSDQTGETEWWRLAANGVGDAQQLSSDAHVIRFDGTMSPDGKWIAYGDKNQDLWLFDVTKKVPTRIATSREGEFSDLAWSPDSRWLAYAEPTATFSRIVIHSIERGTTTAVTDDRVDSYSPSWSPDGKWLYFLSDRNFQSLVGAPWGARQPEPYFDDETKIYQVALVPGLRSPFRPANEVEREDSLRGAAAPKAAETSPRGSRGARSEARPTADTGKAAADSIPRVTIALDGLSGRLFEVPIPAGNYALLSVGKNRLYVISAETGLEGKRHLVALEIKSDPGEPARLVDDVRGYELSADGKKLLVRKGDELHVIDAGASAGVSLGAKTRLDLSGWAFSFPPREEWQQMFREAWRLERDYFYDTAMHGNDWPAVLQKYQPLVERVTDRDELSDLLSQMVSNLSALHTFVYGGDVRRGPDQVQAGSLGALLARDSADGGWKVSRIYRSDPDYPRQLAPLAQPGVDVRESDVIQMINGVPTLGAADPAQLLRNEAGRQVRLRVRSASSDTTRDVIVVPATAARADNLRYDDWEYSRRLAVDSASHDSIGYVHLRAMGPNDIAQWARDFYPVFNRQGLIVDVRHNRGGNIDSWILGRLMRKAWMYWQPRVGNPSWNMQWAFRGHMVVLVDEGTASDGEAFSEGFRRLGLGKIIGTRTWGGEIWLSSSNVLVDRGIATAAETGVYGPQGAWLIEGHGVDPDSVVDNLPHATFEGSDAQLQAALAYLEQQIREHPVPVPPAPAYPKPARRP